MIHFLVPAAQDGSVREYLDWWGRGLAARMRVLHYEDLPGLDRLPGGVLILSSLDQLPPAMTELLRELSRQLAGSGAAVRVVNAPETTLLRFELLAELHRRDMNRFRAVRARSDPGDLRYPVFIREEHQHWASLTPLLESPAELRAALRGLVARGHRKQDLLVVEFCDTRDAEGCFRKYAAYAVGSEIIPRSLSHGRHWSLKHSRSDFTRAMVLEEQRYVLENPHEEQLRQIFAIAGVEYGRIDYALLDGAVQTWEINLNPRIGRGRRPSSGAIPEILQPVRQVTKEFFYRRFNAAFEALDQSSGTGPDIPVRYPVATRRRARAAIRLEAVRRRLAPVARVFQPLRNLLGSLVPFILLAGCAPEPPPFETVADVRQLMNTVLEPAAETYWDAVGSIIDETGTYEFAPATDQEWQAVRNAAVVVAESGNLLMMGGRARDGGGWMAMSRELVAAGKRALAAAEARDPAAVFEVGGEVYEACTACHASYARETLRPSDPRT